MPKSTAKKGKSEKSIGRPSLKTPELIQKIKDLLIEGNSMAAICRMEGMPNYVTVSRWEDEDADFRSISTRARELGTHYMADDCIRISDDTTIDPQHKRFMVETRMRLIGKWNRKAYGDKTTTELTGADGGAVKFEGVTDKDLDARIAALSKKLGEVK